MWKDRDEACLGADRVAKALPGDLDSPGQLTASERELTWGRGEAMLK